MQGFIWLDVIWFNANKETPPNHINIWSNASITMFQSSNDITQNMLASFTKKFLPIIKIVVVYLLKKYLHIFFVRQCQRCTVCSPLSPFLRTVHQNSGFVSEMAMRKKFVREKINKYSGETGGHSITFALKCSFHQLRYFPISLSKEFQIQCNTQQFPLRSGFMHWIGWTTLIPSMLPATHNLSRYPHVKCNIKVVICLL